MRDPNNPCIFCKLKKERAIIFMKIDLAYVKLQIAYPVSKFHHCLIFLKDMLESYFDLT